MHAQHLRLSASVDIESGDLAIVRFHACRLAFTELNGCELTDLLRRIARAVKARRLMLDFSNVTFVTAAGLTALIRAHILLRSDGRRLALRHLNDAVYEVFKVTRLTSLFEVRRAVPAGAK